MNTSIISHRMFVAALSHEENGATNGQDPVRASGKAAKNRAPDRDEPTSAGAARQLLFASVTDGLQSAEA